MFDIVDGDSAERGPSFEGNTMIKYYILFFIIVGSFFFMNLFIGVIFDEYTKNTRNEKL